MMKDEVTMKIKLRTDREQSQMPKSSVIFDNGAELPVLEIRIRRDYSVDARGLNQQFRVYSGDRNPGLYDARQFEVVSETIPSNWIVRLTDNQILVGPRTWLERGFWEDYFNDKEEAVSEFNRHLKIILNES